MNEGMREDAILWEGKPDAGFFGGRGSLTVPQFQVGIVMQDGKVVDIFSERKKKLPRKGEVRTYVASTAPFTLTFWLMDPMDREEPDDGVVLGQPVLTSDDEAVTGRLALTMRVVRKNVEYLLQLLRPGRGGVTRRDVSDAIEGELLAKVLDLDIHQHTAEELRGNRGSVSGDLRFGEHRAGVNYSVLRSAVGQFHGELGADVGGAGSGFGSGGMRRSCGRSGGSRRSRIWPIARGSDGRKRS